MSKLNLAAVLTGLTLLVTTILFATSSKTWHRVVERNCRTVRTLPCPVPICSPTPTPPPIIAISDERAPDTVASPAPAVDNRITPPEAIGTRVHRSWQHDLNEVLAKSSYRGTVLFTNVRLNGNDESSPLPYWMNVENWRRSLALQVPEMKPLICCPDQNSCDMLRRLLQGPCEYYVFTGRVYLERPGFIGGNAVGADWKWFFAQHIVRMGYHAFYSDVDAVFLKDPFPMVETPPLADFYAISDTLDDIGYLIYANRSRAERQTQMENQNVPDCSDYLWKEYQTTPNYCAGASVWFARATIPAYRYVTDVLVLMMQERRQIWEQKAMNAVIHRNRGRGMVFELFDARQAANFMLWSTATASLLANEFPKESRTVLHAGYCHGNEDKDSAFKEWGVWTFADAQPLYHRCHTPPCLERRRNCDSTMVEGAWDCAKAPEKCRWHLTPLPRPELSFADTFLERYRNSTKARQRQD